MVCLLVPFLVLNPFLFTTVLPLQEIPTCWWKGFTSRWLMRDPRSTTSKPQNASWWMIRGVWTALMTFQASFSQLIKTGSLSLLNIFILGSKSFLIQSYVSHEGRYSLVVQSQLPASSLLGSASKSFKCFSVEYGPCSQRRWNGRFRVVDSQSGLKSVESTLIGNSPLNSHGRQVVGIWNDWDDI